MASTDDNGQFSRKMIVTLIGLFLVTVGFGLTAISPLLGAQFTIYVGGISGLVGLFLAGNIGAQFVDQKSATDQHAATVQAQVAAVMGPTSVSAPAGQLEASEVNPK